MIGGPCAPDVVCHCTLERAGLYRLDAAAAGDVDDGPRDGVPAVGVAAAGADRGADLAADPSQRRLAQEVGGRGLSHLQDGPVGKQCGRARPEVEVAGVVGLPGARREVLRAGQARRQLQDRVAVVVGGRRRAVPGGHPDVARRVDLGSGAAHPDRPVVADRHRLVVSRRPPALGHRDDPAAVGRAVPVVAAVAEDDVAVAQVQTGALQNVGLALSRRARRPRRGRRSRCTC